MINPKIPFEKILIENLREQIAVYNKFAQNVNTRNIMKQAQIDNSTGAKYQCDKGTEVDMRGAHWALM